MSNVRTPQPKAETFLKEIGAFTRTSPQQEAVLGCLACRWKRNPDQAIDAMPHGRQIAQCTGLKPGSVYPILERILQGGVMIKRQESVDTTVAERPARQYYLSSDSQRSIDFLASLEAPNPCNMDKNVLADDENNREPSHHDAKHAVLEILASGSNDMVLWVMRAAADELKTRLDSAVEIQPTP